MLSDAQKEILRKMYFARVIGGKHTAVENLKKNVPSHRKGEFEREIKGLVKIGYILLKPTGYGLQVSLNPRMIPDIERTLGIS